MRTIAKVREIAKKITRITWDFVSGKARTLTPSPFSIETATRCGLNRSRFLAAGSTVGRPHRQCLQLDGLPRVNSPRTMLSFGPR